MAHLKGNDVRWTESTENDYLKYQHQCKYRSPSSHLRPALIKPLTRAPAGLRSPSGRAGALDTPQALDPSWCSAARRSQAHPPRPGTKRPAAAAGLPDESGWPGLVEPGTVAGAACNGGYHDDDGGGALGGGGSRFLLPRPNKAHRDEPTGHTNRHIGGGGRGFELQSEVAVTASRVTWGHNGLRVRAGGTGWWDPEAPVGDSSRDAPAGERLALCPPSLARVAPDQSPATRGALDGGMGGADSVASSSAAALVLCLATMAQSSDPLTQVARLLLLSSFPPPDPQGRAMTPGRTSCRSTVAEGASPGPGARLHQAAEACPSPPGPGHWPAAAPESAWVRTPGGPLDAAGPGPNKASLTHLLA